jgi:hypothetical protein
VTLLEYLCTIPGWFVLAFLVGGVIQSERTSRSKPTSHDRVG